MHSKYKNIFAVVPLLVVIIVLTTSIHTLIQKFFLLPYNGLLSTIVETLLLLLASIPLLFIIASQHKLLVRSEEKYRSLVEHNSALIFEFNLEGQLINANPVSVEATGYRLEEILLKPYQYLVIKEHVKLAKHYFDRATKGELLNFELSVLHNSGKVIELGLKSVPIVTGNQITGLFLIGKDITERKKMEGILLKSEKLSVAGQLAAGVAHEIRNPLTTLRGFVQLMLNSGTSHKRYLKIMLSELDRINLIVGEFLILSKPHLRQFVSKDLRNILQDVITLLEPQAMLSNIRFHLQLPTEESLVGCEENELKQVFINLLKNAMEAMPAGGDIQILAKRDESGQVLLRFTDQGCGIPSENLAKLGEPFFTTKEKGTGLGMMITYKIIEDHNGKISIQSNLNVGTTVEILLPLQLQDKPMYQTNGSSL